MRGSEPKATLVAALLMGAIVWGLVWFPFRVLGDLGVGGEFASAMTYVLSLALALVSYRRQLANFRFRPVIVQIALVSGFCNVGFLLATIHGHVVRVVLLFYLAPAWTVVFAYLILGERLSLQGVFLMLFALCGAIVMLWDPALGLPLPGDVWEWVALGAGILFALCNVLLRSAQQDAIEHKSTAIFAGCAIISLLACVLMPNAAPALANLPWMAYALMALIGVTMWAANYAIQYGLGRVPANQAIVIYLSELVVAAISSWLLAGEILAAREWIGGTMIVCASLLSSRLRPPETKVRVAQAALEGQ